MRLVILAAALWLSILLISLGALPSSDEPFTELYFTDHSKLPSTIPFTVELPYLAEVRPGVYQYGMVIDVVVGSPEVVPLYRQEFPRFFVIPGNRTQIVYYSEGRSVPANRTQYLRIATPRMPFNFTIVNHEGGPVTYLYQIRVEDGTHVVHMENGTVLLGPNQSATIEGSARFTELFERAKVVVELPDQGQHIHFWVERSQ